MSPIHRKIHLGGGEGERKRRGGGEEEGVRGVPTGLLLRLKMKKKNRIKRRNKNTLPAGKSTTNTHARMHVHTQKKQPHVRATVSQTVSCWGAFFFGHKQVLYFKQNSKVPGGETMGCHRVTNTLLSSQSFSSHSVILAWWLLSVSAPNYAAFWVHTSYSWM